MSASRTTTPRSKRPSPRPKATTTSIAAAGETAAPSRAVPPLPAFVEPMLAKPGRPFDSPDYLFELKWDGTRCLAFVEGGGRVRMVNRRRADITDRYPDVVPLLAALPPGTLLDGEVVVLRDGRPDFEALMSREQCRSELRRRQLLRSHPATFVAFDLLYRGGRSVMDLPCHERRSILRGLLAGSQDPHLANRHLAMSEGVVGSGSAYFEEACRRGLEGVVAKRLDSRYLPGRRTDAWVKVKRGETLACVVVGFVPEGDDDFGALVVAAPDGAGTLACVGKVGSGFDAAARAEVNAYLWSHLRARPVVACPGLRCDAKPRWVEPGLCCLVRCMERTRDGHLRAPVFGGICHGT